MTLPIAAVNNAVFVKPSRLSRREWAKLVAAAPLTPAAALRDCTLANQAVEVAIGIDGSRVHLRSIRNRLTGETAELPSEDFALEFEGGYRVTSSELKVTVSRVSPSELMLLFSNDRLEVRVARQLPPGKAYIRKQLSVRTRGGPPLRLLRAELDDWRGARRNWRSMTADSARYGSHPIYCESFWAGVEFVVAFNEYGPDGFLLCSRPGGRQVDAGWTALRPTVCGACRAGAAREAFLAYLEDVRLAPPRMVACYNSWWTLPQVVTQDLNLALIRELKAAMYDRHGVFFDIITTDMGWSNPRSIWELDRSTLPRGFDDIYAVLGPTGARLGLWMSPSERYPDVCDYAWAEKAGYVVVRRKDDTPALSLADPRYREETKAALRKLIRENKLAHVKYDGFLAEEDRPHHGLLPGLDSVEPLAEYSLELLRAAKQENPDLITEPTYMNSFANYISPWILMYSDTIWGNAGGDLPPGMTPAPDYREAATTAREWYIFSSHEEVWAPQNALHYFDIVHVDAREGFPNHAAMAFGRGGFFLSTYVNPKVMNAEDWCIYAGMLKWARANTDILRHTLVVPSNLESGEPYIYAHWEGKRGILAVRNPSNESKDFPLDLARAGAPRDLADAICYAQYPCREGIADGLTAASTVRLSLEPWELVFLEIVPRAALKEVVAIGARWHAGNGGLSLVPNRGVTTVRLLEPGDRSHSVVVKPRIVEQPAGRVLSQSLRPAVEDEWLTGTEFRQPEFTFQYPAEFGSEEIRKLEAARKQKKFRTVAFELECEVTIPAAASRGQVLLLLQFPGREYCPSACSAWIDEAPATTESRPSSVRFGFYVDSRTNYWKAAVPLENEWCWYIADVSGGRHRLRFRGHAGHANPRLGVWVWAEHDLESHAVSVPIGCSEPAMPQYRAGVERDGARML